MKRFVSCAITLLLLLPSAAAALIMGDDPGARSRTALEAEIRRLVSDSAFSASFIGVKIISLDDSTLIFEQNSQRLFHPASNMKLLTSATALHRLPPGFRFRTSVAARGAVRDGILSGDLVVIGSGDPLLMPEDLDSLAVQVAGAGIRTVTGALVGDVSRFDSIIWGKGWMWDDEPSSDFPFLTPLTVHKNAIEIRVTPGRQIGHEPGIEVTPAWDDLLLFNEAVTARDTLVPELEGTRTRNTNRFAVTGRIAPDDTAEHLGVTVWEPDAWFLTLLREKLLARGVRIEGRNVVTSVPTTGAEGLGSVSRGLDTVLQVINKESSNLSAELLLKTLARESGIVPGSALGGLAVVKEYLASAGIDTAAMILADGSGISWYTLVSPEAVTRLLAAEHGQPATFERFRRSLALAGVDGTLRSRMKGTRAEGNAAAKTGTLTGVSTLSGYVTSADGKPLAFSILCNHFPGQISLLRTMQNTIVALLAGANLRSE